MTMKHFARGLAISPLIVIGLLVAAAMMPIAPAFGQDAAADSGSRVSFQPLVQVAIPYLIDLFLVAMFALASVVAVWVKKKFNIDAESALLAIEARHRDALHTAIKSAVAGIAARGGSLSFDFRSQAVADVVRYVRDSVPDAVKALTPSDKVIGTIAQAKAAELAVSPMLISVPEVGQFKAGSPPVGL